MALITAKDPEGLELIRHDAAHVLAQGGSGLVSWHAGHDRPGDRRRILLRFRARGAPFSSEDFEKIEKKMAEIVDADYPIIREVWDKDQAIETFKSIGEDYKAQIIDDIIPPGEADHGLSAG